MRFIGHDFSVQPGPGNTDARLDEHEIDGSTDNAMAGATLWFQRNNMTRFSIVLDHYELKAFRELCSVVARESRVRPAEPGSFAWQVHRS